MTDQSTQPQHRIDLASLVRSLDEQQAAKEDIVLSARSLTMEHTRGLALAYPSLHAIELPTFEGIDLPVPTQDRLTEIAMISNVAHQQIGERYAIPRAYYTRLEREAPALLAENVNHWLRADTRNVLLRTFSTPQGAYARAILSDRYRVVDNLDVLYSLLEEVHATKTPARITHCDITDERMHVRVEFPEMQEDFAALIRRDGTHNWNQAGPDPWFGGLILSNSETGNGSVSIRPRLIRAVCSNGAIIEHAVLKQFHLGGKLNEGFYEGDRTRKLENEILFSRIKDIVAQLTDPELFRSLMQSFTGSAEVPLAHPVAAATNIASAIGLSEERKNQLLERFVTHDASTQFGIADAVTWLAHDYETSDAEMAVTLESFGGRMLTMPSADFRSSYDHKTN